MLRHLESTNGGHEAALPREHTGTSSAGAFIGVLTPQPSMGVQGDGWFSRELGLLGKELTCLLEEQEPLEERRRLSRRKGGRKEVGRK